MYSFESLSFNTRHGIRSCPFHRAWPLATNSFKFDQNINGMQSLMWANFNLHWHQNLQLLRSHLNNAFLCSNQLHNQSLMSHMDVLVQLVNFRRMNRDANGVIYSQNLVVAIIYDMCNYM